MFEELTRSQEKRAKLELRHDLRIACHVQSRRSKIDGVAMVEVFTKTRVKTLTIGSRGGLISKSDWETVGQGLRINRKSYNLISDPGANGITCKRFRSADPRVIRTKVNKPMLAQTSFQGLRITGKACNLFLIEPGQTRLGKRKLVAKNGAAGQQKLQNESRTRPLGFLFLRESGTP